MIIRIEYVLVVTLSLLLSNDKQRTSLQCQHKQDLRAWTEAKAMSNFDGRYCELPKTTKSTISISFSPCGKYFASTHGDHTVKIISYPEGRIIQTLIGHERTPWTVKFHPTDSNIVASGCLAFDVRIWDIALGQTVRRIKVDKHVVGLDFHPFEPIVVGLFSQSTPSQNLSLFIHTYIQIIASVQALHMWRYQTDQSASVAMRTNRGRSLRCVQFLSSGEYIVAGVTEKRMRVRGGINTVELSMFRFNCRSRPILTEPRVIVRHVMLYNAGGFALSPDERFIVVCVEKESESSVDEIDMRSRSLAMPTLLLPPSLPGRRVVAANNEIRGGTMSRLSELSVSTNGTTNDASTINFTPLTPPVLSRSLRRNESKYCLRVLSIFSDQDKKEGRGRVIVSRDIEIARAREITSVKFSPSCEYILLGYQKRTEGIDVLRNNMRTNERAVGRVYRACDMKLVNTITRPDDDVNIALFHPIQGNGFVYGTKQGRVCIVAT